MVRSNRTSRTYPMISTTSAHASSSWRKHRFSLSCIYRLTRSFRCVTAASAARSIRALRPHRSVYSASAYVCSSSRGLPIITSQFHPEKLFGFFGIELFVHSISINRTPLTCLHQVIEDRVMHNLSISVPDWDKLDIELIANVTIFGHVLQSAPECSGEQAGAPDLRIWAPEDLLGNTGFGDHL